MKINLTPEIAYLIGMWCVKKSKIGVGIYGRPHVREYFIKRVLDAGLMPSHKILTSGKRTYFYHNGYNKYFNDIEKELDKRFRSVNTLSSAFVAGMFDASGKKEGDILKFYNMRQDKFLLIERLGFRFEKAGKFLVPVPQEKFKKLVEPYSQILQDPYFNEEAMEDWVDEKYGDEEDDDEI